MKPRTVTDLDMAFGGGCSQLLPPMSAIPDEFKSGRNPWVKLQRRWFFSGLPANAEFYVRDGIDFQEAMRHLAAVQRSFEPKHEHKEAAVAYLMSEWFERVEADGQTLAGRGATR